MAGDRNQSPALGAPAAIDEADLAAVSYSLDVASRRRMDLGVREPRLICVAENMSRYFYLNGARR
jgi:hypothetical protein